MITNAGEAHEDAQLICNQKVVGSIPIFGSKEIMTDKLQIIIGLIIGTLVMAVVGLISLYSVALDTYKRTIKFGVVVNFLVTTLVAGVLGFAVAWSIYGLLEILIQYFWR